VVRLLKPRPSFIRLTLKLTAIETAAGQHKHLMLFARTLPKAINKLHRQKASCSANLDSPEVQPSLRDSISCREGGSLEEDQDFKTA
jgi:hypothetical protein